MRDKYLCIKKEEVLLLSQDLCEFIVIPDQTTLLVRKCVICKFSVIGSHARIPYPSEGQSLN